MLNWAIEREYLDRTPFRRGAQAVIRLERENNRRSCRLTPDEEKRLLKAAGPTMKALIVAALDTGCAACGLDRLVAFSCKGRGFCPRCGGRRMARLLERRGLAGDAESGEAADLWSTEAPVLAAAAAASVDGRVALGPRAGARIRRCGDPPEEVTPATVGPCHAHAGGFDLHAGLLVRAGQRDRLERLCRYALRPPLAQERLHTTREGEIWLTLRHR